MICCAPAPTRTLKRDSSTHITASITSLVSHVSPTPLAQTLPGSPRRTRVLRMRSEPARPPRIGLASPHYYADRHVCMAQQTIFAHRAAAHLHASRFTGSLLVPPPPPRSNRLPPRRRPRTGGRGPRSRMPRRGQRKRRRTGRGRFPRLKSRGR